MDNYENNLVNLVNLSNINIKLYDNKNNIKSTQLLIKQFENVKKKELKEIKKSTIQLSNLAKTKGGNNINDLREHNILIQNNIDNVNNIDNIINYISYNYENIKNEKINKFINKYSYIECYSN